MSIETIATDIGIKLLKRGLNAIQLRFCSDKALSEKIQKKRRGESNKTHISGLCLISKGGKTTLQNNLNKMVLNNDALSKKDKSKVFAVDTDSLLRLHTDGDTIRKVLSFRLEGNESMAKVIEKPIIRESFEKLCKSYDGWRIIVLSSDLSLLEFLGIQDIAVLLPTNNLFKEILKSVEPESEKERINDDRILLAERSENRFTSYKSYEHLEDIVSSNFGLKRVEIIRSQI
jgi:hypothetical protein